MEASVTAHLQYLYKRASKNKTATEINALVKLFNKHERSFSKLLRCMRHWRNSTYRAFD